MVVVKSNSELPLLQACRFRDSVIAVHIGQSSYLAEIGAVARPPLPTGSPMMLLILPSFSVKSLPPPAFPSHADFNTRESIEERESEKASYDGGFLSRRFLPAI